MSAYAIVWPQPAQAPAVRLGYTVSQGAYLRADAAAGVTIVVETGSAIAYAGFPDALGHRQLATIFPGQPYTIAGLSAGEVVSVQSGSAFTYTITMPPPAPDPGPVNPDGSSVFVTLSCTGSPCPWGSSDSGHALVWPTAMQALNARLGYTASKGIYLPDAAAMGISISIQTGAVTVYAGLPDAPGHRQLATMFPGQSYTIAGLAAGEVVSVQSGSAFTYTITVPPPAPAPNPGSSSVLVTWSCTGSPCPWGSSDSGHALVWPTAMQALDARLGYTTSKRVYLPNAAALGLTITIQTGAVTVYAGLPDAPSHRQLATILPGQSYALAGLTAGEVVSVQSGSAFTYSLASVPGPGPDPVPPNPGDPEGSSRVVTWSCTSSPCPWGSAFTGNILVWPTAMQALGARLGYTASKGVYLPDAAAMGISISIQTGAVTVYAGLPDALSHRQLATIFPGQSYTIAGLAAGEVVSVQSGTTFTYTITLPAPAPAPDPGNLAGSSVLVTWSCTGSPCPWGPSDSGHALVWPATVNALDTRLGYTASKRVYLPDAIGWTIGIGTGAVTVYAGLPNAASHRAITSILSGQSYTIAGLVPGEVVSVQSGSAFTYTMAPPSPGTDPDDPPPAGVLQSTPAIWRCNTPGCTDPDWTGAVITWPSWAAYSTNNRASSQSRTVYTQAGDLLYPYMGSWANGCEVTAHSGLVLIIEWQRGTNVWRETYLTAGQTHVISLTEPENGAMIETADGIQNHFSVTLNNCTPQPIAN